MHEYLFQFNIFAKYCEIKKKLNLNLTFGPNTEQINRLSREFTNEQLYI
jgi:hypothetical protein